jgi:CHASE3 domain sensor protein
MKKGSQSMRTIRWTVGRKLLLGFGVVALLIAIMAGIGFTATMAIRESFNKVAEDTVLELEALSKIQASALELQNETYAYVLFGAADDLEETEEALQELDEAIELYAAAGEGFDTDDEVGREMGHSLQAAIADLKTGSAEMSAQVEEVVASAEELTALAEELRSATAQFRL